MPVEPPFPQQRPNRGGAKIKRDVRRRGVAHRPVEGDDVCGEAQPAAQPQATLQFRRRGVVLGVKGLSLAKLDQFGVELRDIGFEVRAGEIVGVAGVSTLG